MTNGKIKSLAIFINSLSASSLTKNITGILSRHTWGILHHHLEKSLKSVSQNVSHSFSVVGFEISPHFVDQKVKLLHFFPKQIKGPDIFLDLLFKL